MMGKVIVVANQKGGVGKTTTAINFSSYLAVLGKKVLLIDMDPQGNSTAGSGISNGNEGFKKNIYECLINDINPNEAIYQTKVSDFYVLPADINLAGAQVELNDMENREFYLKKVTGKLKSAYDYIIIDAPPSLGILTVN
ncbi:MAG: AAA family ATPase, partial [Spirochaetes bacterium]|nr:AAA family ATPase [Spirochaetota bacterium]